MTRERKLLFFKFAAVIAALPILMLGHSAGPDPGKSGAPGDSTCAESGCHIGNGNPHLGTGVGLTTSQGLTYTPGGAKQQITVTVNGTTAKGYGFQATVRDPNNNQAGSLTPVDGTTWVQCADGSNPPCKAPFTVQYIQHTMPNTKNTFTFDWTPPATNIGNVKFYVGGNAVNLDGTPNGDFVYINNFALTPASGGGGGTTPTITLVQPAFLGKSGISAKTWVEIYGSNLAGVPAREWGGGDFTGNQAPTSLDGVKVTVDGKSAFVRYISDSQINVQVPDGIGIGDGIQLQVTNANGTGSTTISTSKVSPALLTTAAFNVSGKQWIAALFPDNKTFAGKSGLIAGVPFQPAKPGDVLIVYAIGCGDSTPASPAGQFFSDARQVSSSYQFMFGQTPATSQGFLAAGAVGLCQFNVTVPNVANGDVAVDITLGGVSTKQNLFTTIQK